MKRSWWHVVKHVLFGVHSPSRVYQGACWCQRKRLLHVFKRRQPSLILGRYGVGLAYRTVLKDESTWRDVRGLWFNTKWGQLWLTLDR